MKEPDTDVLIEAGTMVEIDAEHIAQIILTLCATQKSTTSATPSGDRKRVSRMFVFGT